MGSELGAGNVLFQMSRQITMENPGAVTVLVIVVVTALWHQPRFLAASPNFPQSNLPLQIDRASPHPMEGLKLMTVQRKVVPGSANGSRWPEVGKCCKPDPGIAILYPFPLSCCPRSRPFPEWKVHTYLSGITPQNVYLGVQILTGCLIGPGGYRFWGGIDFGL